MNFSDYLTLDQFKIILAHDNIEPIDNAWRDKYRKIKDENFDVPMLAFLEAKRDNEGLTKIQYSEGHLTRFSESWNKFVEHEKTDRQDVIPDSFYKVLSNATLNYEKAPVTDEFILERYNKLVQTMTKGDFRPHELSEDACQCHDCGQRFKMNIKDWAPTFNVFGKKPDGSLDYRSFVAPESCLASNIQEVKVNFPTGELIVSDWVVIEEFTKTVEYEGKDKWSDEKSISFGKGRIFMTSHYAQKYNFVHVNVGNSSPHVFQNENSLVVGRLEYNKEKDDYDELDSKGNFKQAASVCTDLWGVTLIDKQTLIEIVSIKSDKASEIVEKYLKENTNHEIVNVSPGDYTLKFHANYYDFDKTIKDSDLPNEVEKFFTVSSSPKPQNKKKI